MAFGNLFGSNLFDMAILGIDDVFYTKGVLTSQVSPTHQIAAVAAMTMTAVAVVANLSRDEKEALPRVGFLGNCCCIRSGDSRTLSPPIEGTVEIISRAMNDAGSPSI